MNIKIAFLATAIATLFSAQVFADTDSSLPPVQSQGEVQFISGGIGKNESEAMVQAGKSWPLMLELSQATASGAQYIADVDVSIQDKQGNAVLNVDSAGPYLLIRLAPGRYALTATYESKILNRQLHIAEKGGKKIALIWPAQQNNGMED